jgi:putative DNA methylase
MFTARQKVALLTLVQFIQRIEQIELKETLALVISKLSELACALCAWEPIAECPRHIFGRQAIGMAWDFGEGVLNSSSSGSFMVTLENAASALNALIPLKRGSSPQIADAAKHPLPDQAAQIWFIDPPYYDSVPYSYISDFFYVWIKRTLGWVSRDSDPRELTPKSAEIVAYTPGNETSSAYALYEKRMTLAFSEGMRVLQPDGLGSVVFAHKTTEGWEALLSGLIGSGWTITASWPIATEMASRLRARESAALGTSVHLICRPRTDTTAVGDWAHVLRELPKRVGDWMYRLQDEGVRGADLVFACIGPALEIFSRYKKVESADGREVALAEYLEKVWEVVGRSALAQVLGTAEAKARNGAAGAIEEDSRLTALFLWTLQATDGEAPEDTINEDEDEDEDGADDQDEDDGTSRVKAKGFTLVYDVVRRFAQPLGIDLRKWEGRVIETKKGVVRLLPIAARAEQLFGEDGAQAVAARLERDVVLGPNPLQGMLFPEMEATPKVRGRGTRSRSGRMSVEASDQRPTAAHEATTLDRVHAAMLLQASGRTNALRSLLKAEQERPDFLRLANALSALYPKGSEEKRLLDAMLLAMPR